MFQEKKVYTTKWAGKELTVEIGEMARQANAAVVVKYGDTVVLTTAVASKEAKDVDFFPLTVNYEEKMYAVGKIPGGFLRREGRPGTEATLAARLIDRPIRPLFEDGFRNEVQVISTVLSVEYDCDPVMAAMLGSSLSLSVSNIPFKGPIAGVTVGYIDGEYIINPNIEQLEKSEIDLKVAGTSDAINMVEAGAKEVSEEIMLNAIMFGHEEIKRLIAFQQQIVDEIGQEKMEVELKVIDENIYNEVLELALSEMKSAISIKDKQERDEAISAVKEKVVAIFEERATEEDELDIVKEAKLSLDKIVKDEVRREITEDKVRPDGRALTEIRPLASRIDVLPRTHGSALFTRGQTQSLGVVTLGNLSDEQIIDDLTQEENKRFMLHYNFPAFSVGEVGFSRAPGRREIGHGALGERALAQVIPSKEDFPYTIRIVSEILESNGSSSQATICSGSMALMAAGVPIKAQVAGIAMGLVKKDEHYTILTDIQGMEDHLGDMDFKVAGTKNGICALQMDIKIKGITKEILIEALNEAKKARIKILKVMKSAISEPRKELSEYAPKMLTFNIKPEKIKEVIGKGGETITKIIQEASGVISVNDVKAVKIDIDDFGKVIIYHKDKKVIDKTKAMIDNIVKELEFGKVYPAVIKEIKDFGCIVEFWEGMEGLVHISKLSKERIENIKDKFSVGDKVDVEVLGLDKKGKIDLRVKEKEKNPIKKIMEKIIKND